MRVEATLSRSGIKDLRDFVGLPFLSPEGERLGVITDVVELPGPYCKVSIAIEPACITNEHVKALFFPEMAMSISWSTPKHSRRSS